MKATHLFFLAAAAAFTAFACGKDEEPTDSVKPSIDLHEPMDKDSLGPGPVHLEMDLADNVELASYKIDMHLAVGHSHTKSDAQAAPIVKTWQIEAGKKNTHIHHHEFVIPVGTPVGDYHFMVYCTDKTGNETFIVRTLYVDNVAYEHDEE